MLQTHPSHVGSKWPRTAHDGKNYLVPKSSKRRNRTSIVINIIIVKSKSSIFYFKTIQWIFDYPTVYFVTKKTRIAGLSKINFSFKILCVPKKYIGIQGCRNIESRVVEYWLYRLNFERLELQLRVLISIFGLL